MINLVHLGSRFHVQKIMAAATQEGAELERLKGEFKEAFMSYLNWGGRYVVQQPDEKTLENKSVRKMDEWVLQKERMDASAPILVRMFNIARNVFTAIISCFYLPSYEDQKVAYQNYYAQVHQSLEPGAQIVQACRLAKHRFKDEFTQATRAERDAFFTALYAMHNKGKYWDSKIPAPIPDQAEAQVPNEAAEAQVPNEAAEAQVPNEAAEAQVPNQAAEAQA